MIFGGGKTGKSSTQTSPENLFYSVEQLKRGAVLLMLDLLLYV